MVFEIILVLVVLVPILAVVLDPRLRGALAARIEGRPDGTSGDLTAERIAWLEGEVERLGEEVHRLDEESEFLRRLLDERPAPGKGAALPPGDEPT